MHIPMDLAHLRPYLAAAVERYLHLQISDPSHPGFGALVTSDDGRPSPPATAGLVAAGGYQYVLAGDPDGDLAQRVQMATDALLKLQRPGGLVDLPIVNIDSGPDTGFIVQRLCTVVELLRGAPGLPSAWVTVMDGIGEFIRRAAPGMAAGGYHTPNHRWVVSSALAQSMALFPDLDSSVPDAIEAYLAEGIDVDDEGFFIERSVGVYDGVNTLSWLLLAEHWDVPAAALDGVAKCLAVDLRLLHADGTAETGLSHRQDYGQRTVPSRLIPCYLMYHALRSEPGFVAAARWLWLKAQRPSDTLWTIYALLKVGTLPDVAAGVPDDFTLYLADNELWRLRRGPLSVSVFGGTPRLLSLGYGTAMLRGVRIDQTYFGEDCGRFIAGEMAEQRDGVALHSDGRWRPRRPGYELPLGRLVPPEQWRSVVPERGLRELPPAVSNLTVTEIEDGVELIYENATGIAGVAVQLALDFDPGGIWETADTRVKPEPGQAVFLKSGWGEMRYGTDVIRVEGGAYAHSMWAMRETQPPGSSVRVLLTFDTPATHTFKLVGRQSPDAV